MTIPKVLLGQLDLKKDVLTNELTTSKRGGVIQWLGRVVTTLFTSISFNRHKVCESLHDKVTNAALGALQPGQKEVIWKNLQAITLKFFSRTFQGQGIKVSGEINPDVIQAKLEYLEQRSSTYSGESKDKAFTSLTHIKAVMDRLNTDGSLFKSKTLSEADITRLKEARKKEDAQRQAELDAVAAKNRATQSKSTQSYGRSEGPTDDKGWPVSFGTSSDTSSSDWWSKRNAD